MKGFVILLLGVIFVAFITNSVPSIATDDSGGNNADSEDADKLNIVPTESPKYKIYLHVVVQNAHGELVSVTDTMSCQFGRNCSTHLPYEVTDYVFDTLLGKKEIVIIDNIKYEKVQFSTSSDNQWLFDMYDREYTSIWEVEICGEPIKKYGYECANIFWTKTGLVFLEMDDVTTANWTILREMN
jgi:hypothetical protein